MVSLKKKLVFGLMLSLFLLSSSFIIPLFIVSADVPPSVSTIAEYNENVVLDGSADEYSNSSLIYVDIFPFESHDPPILLTASINFAYDNNWLYGFVYIPDTYGYVSAVELIFFGRDDQGGSADGVWMNATNNEYQDHGFYRLFEEPFNDVAQGGTNDVVAYSTSHSGGGYFEFKKLLSSSDTNGLDFSLSDGASIGVFLVAWIGSNNMEGPNWGMVTETEFRYIRLSIGFDSGEPINVPPPPSEEMHWIISNTIYQAVYYANAADELQLDGYRNESMWRYSYHVTLYYTAEGYDSTNFFDGDIWLAHDGEYLYIFFEIYDEVDDTGDFTAFGLSTNERMFEDPNGFDIVSMSTGEYSDMRFDPSLQQPMIDTQYGGVINGEAYVSHYDNMRHIEFKKELNSGDINGADLNVTNLDEYAYIFIVAGYQVAGDPNYMEIEMDSENNPALAIHPIQFLAEGQEPTGNVETEGGTTSNNTFVIGLSPIETLILTLGTFTIITVPLVKKKRYSSQ